MYLNFEIRIFIFVFELASLAFLSLELIAPS